MFASTVLLWSAQALAIERYVDVVNGGDGPGCGSTASPCATIQYAVNLSASGDEVRVAEGTYVYAGASVDPCVVPGIDSPTVLCVLDKEVTIRGGYSSPNWTGRKAGALTIIDAQSLRRGVYAVDTSPATTPTSLTLEGVKIRNGRVEGASSGDFFAVSAYGGGLLAHNAAVELRGVVFENNQAVGGTTTQQYGGDGGGGGAWFRGVLAAVSLEFVTFFSNDAYGGNGAERGGYALGGGFGACCGASLTGENIRVEGNTALGGGSSGAGDVTGARADGLGGGVAMGTAYNGDGTGGSTCELSLISIIDNVAQGGAGATYGAYAFGGGLFAEGLALDPTSVTLRDATISGNNALGGSSFKAAPAFGGGVATAEASLLLERAEVTNNRATGGDGGVGPGSDRGTGLGGGIHVQRLSTASVSVTLRNTVVADNSVESGASGDFYPGGGGGGLSAQGNINPLLEHVTFARNQIDHPGLIGLALLLVAFPAPPTLDLKYAVVADHDTISGKSALFAQSGSVFNLDTGLFAGNFDDTNNGDPGAGTYTGLGSFLNFASAGFVDPGPPSFDYHVASNSESIDRGTGSAVTLDFDGQARDLIPDLGADEVGLASALFADGFESSGVWGWSSYSRH